MEEITGTITATIQIIIVITTAANPSRLTPDAVKVVVKRQDFIPTRVAVAEAVEEILPEEEEEE